MARLTAPLTSGTIRRLVVMSLLTIVLVPFAVVLVLDVLAGAGRNAHAHAVERAARASALATTDVERATIARREQVHLWRIDAAGRTVFERDESAPRQSDLGMASIGAGDHRADLERGRPPPGTREHVVLARESAQGWSTGCATYVEARLLVCEAAMQTPQGDTVLAQRIAPRVVSRLLDAREGLLLLTAMVMLAGGALAVWLVRRLTRPLAALAQQVEARASGQRDSISIEHAPAEIATVARTVDLLARQLEAHGERQAQAAADLAHEIKSPLARIRLAVDAEGLPASARAALDQTARAAVEAIDRVIHDLLEIARAEQGVRRDEVARSSLHELVQEVLADHPPPERVVIRVEGTALAEVAPTSVRRAIRHLLDNAFSHARSSVTVTLAMDATRASIGVCDDGPGVPEELKPRLFERFASRRPGGTGLGLAYVRAVAVAHHGSATASRADAGTRFVIELPRVHTAFTHV